MFKKFTLGSFLLLSIPAYAQLFSADTTLLIELVSTTASQLNELEKLVTNAEKYTQKMQQYNELMQDEYFRAERIAYIAESVVARKEVKNLGDLNYAIRELKYSMSEMKELMKEYAIIKEDEKKTKEKVRIEKELNEKKEKMASSQIDKSIKSKSVGRSNQLTAQNTALIYESNVDMHNTQLEILEKVATTNKLLAEQMEEKRLEQMEREKSYGHEKKRGGKK